MHTLLKRPLVPIFLMLFLGISLPALAAEAPPPTEDADESSGFDAAGAEVNIITEGDKTIEEYSLNGRVYMVKIQQKGFPAYYLIDRDGDGRMDEQVSDLMGPAAAPPNWVLFRW